MNNRKQKPKVDAKYSDKELSKKIKFIPYGISPFCKPGEKPQTVDQIISNQ